jgi:hypothetical protein
VSNTERLDPVEYSVVVVHQTSITNPPFIRFLTKLNKFTSVINSGSSHGLCSMLAMGHEQPTGKRTRHAYPLALGATDRSVATASSNECDNDGYIVDLWLVTQHKIVHSQSGMLWPKRRRPSLGRETLALAQHIGPYLQPLRSDMATINSVVDLWAVAQHRIVGFTIRDAAAAQ